MRVLLHPSDQPVFRLAVRVAQCRLELRINDVPVFRDNTGDALFFELPVNQWLFQGRNDIDVHLAPVESGAYYGKQAQIEITLQHKIARDAHKNLADVGVLRWQPAPAPLLPHADGIAPDHLTAAAAEEDDAPLLALPGQDEECQWRIYPARQMKEHAVFITTSLPLPPPWPSCPWHRGEVLSEDTGAQFSIERLARSFHDGMLYGGWENLAAPRRAALQSAYYLREDELDDALGFPKLLRDESWTLPPLQEKGLTLEIAGNGRLAQLISDDTRESPLILVNEKEGVAATIGAWWMFGGQWIMVR